jgi:cyclophilin family peptidyl-prolyl cis-trans isomerase
MIGRMRTAVAFLLLSVAATPALAQEAAPAQSPVQAPAQAQTTAAAPASAQTPAPASAQTPTPEPAKKRIEIHDVAHVRIETNLGDIVVKLDAIRAPLTVQNFVQYAVDGYYDGTIFHRVIPTFIAQGGGYLPDLTEKPADRTVVNESGNGLTNKRGTIGMARTSDPHSARAQFYFNLVDNAMSLDPRPTRWGYAVFGEVEDGLDVLDKIGSVPTGAGGEFDRDVPVEPIIIKHVELLPD